MTVQVKRAASWLLLEFAVFKGDQNQKKTHFSLEHSILLTGGKIPTQSEQVPSQCAFLIQA